MAIQALGSDDLELVSGACKKPAPCPPCSPSTGISVSVVVDVVVGVFASFGGLLGGGYPCK